MIDKYNTDLLQSIKWLQNDAPNIQALIQAKSDWLKTYNDDFWTDWETNVFDLDTANAFGLAVWCIILGVSVDMFDFNPSYQVWAFGVNRQNFIDESGVSVGGNEIGGNFVGAEAGIKSLDEVRIVLKLRYLTLVSNGRIQFINKILNYIINKGEPWDYYNGVYAYVIDATTQTIGGLSYLTMTDWQGAARVTTFTQYAANQDTSPESMSATIGVSSISATTQNPATNTFGNTATSTASNGQHLVALVSNVLGYTQVEPQALMTGVVYNYSIYFKNNGASKVMFSCTNTVDAYSTVAGSTVIIDFSTGTVAATSPDGATFVLTPVGGDFYRLQIVFSYPIGVTYSVVSFVMRFINASGAISYPGVTTDSIILSYCIVVQGASPIPYNSTRKRLYGAPAGDVRLISSTAVEQFQAWTPNGMASNSAAKSPDGVANNARGFLENGTVASQHKAVSAINYVASANGINTYMIFVKVILLTKLKLTIDYTPAAGATKYDFSSVFTLDVNGDVTGSVPSTGSASAAAVFIDALGTHWAKIAINTTNVAGSGIVGSSNLSLVINALDDTGADTFIAQSGHGFNVYGPELILTGTAVSSLAVANRMILPPSTGLPSATARPIGQQMTSSLGGPTQYGYFVPVDDSVFVFSSGDYVKVVGEYERPNVTIAAFNDFNIVIDVNPDDINANFVYSIPPIRTNTGDIVGMEYYFGPGINLSAITIAYLADRSRGLLPSCGGVPFTVTKDI